MRKATATLIVILAATTAVAADRKIKITKRYLNYPVSHSVDRRWMTLSVGGQQACRSVIRLTDGAPDYWVFEDVTMWKGKTLTINFDGDAAALAKIFQADTIMGESEIYHEQYRPQYHFTTRRGWINDPNGLVFFKGKYHMFYQHNPYEREWENMHWGHAVSTDLLHWQELPLALHPDTIGTMFSGSAVAVGDTLYAFYTADLPQYERQCMAYSTDEGLTWTKYNGNPVINSHERWQSHDTRDPKVFWYAPGKHWVLVLNERDGHTIYNSTNLVNWTPMSHITGFWECPELFSLNGAWVMWGASGTYMTGTFDGKTFTPLGPKQCSLNGAAYAAQCFNNIPATDGRVIKMAWGRISFDDMPFNGCMLLPQEQVLVNTSQGLRLYSRPVAETEQLFEKAYEGHDLSQTEANKALEAFNDNDLLRIRLTLQLTYATDAGLKYRGQRLLDYDMNGNRLQGEFFVPDSLTPDPSPTGEGRMQLTADIYVDRAIVEGYINDGAFSYSMKRDVKSRSTEGYTLYGNQLKIKQLEVYKLTDRP